MNYLQNNKDNVKKPIYYAGTQKQWEEIRKKYQSVENDMIEQLLQDMSNFDVFEDPVLVDHIDKYRRSIKLGNAVSVVGHSQGSLYANFAYDVLINDHELGKYLNVSAFGTIAKRVASAQNNMRMGSDAYVLDQNDDSKYLSAFDHLPFNAKNTNPPHKDGTHVFLSYINGNDTAPKIYTMIKNQIQENIDRPSRWRVVDESDKARKKGTSEYRIKVSYGDKIVDNVLPFGLSEKDKIHYVKIKGSDKKMLIKGSCNATSIIDHTNDKPEDELIVDGQRVLYELEGAKQYIFGEKVCKDPSIFEVVGYQNPNTANWRVTVKNRETNETVEGVYPFNLKGSLYQLDSGEWVLASCGGEEILSEWEGKSQRQFYKLEGTDPVEYIEANKSKKSFLLKTGQTRSYADFDDGYYQIGKERSYTRDDEKEVVIDNATGLMWQDNAEAKTVQKNWYNAKSYCQNLILGGYSDWRVPTILELKSIIDMGREHPATDPVFQYIVNDDYWSSTVGASKYSEDNVWIYNFYKNEDYWDDKTDSVHIRCVRSEIDNDINFIRKSDQTVLDAKMGLMWQDDADAKIVSKDWKGAIDYCKNLSLAGYNDWRLPNYNEMESIVDYNWINPAINRSFKNIATSLEATNYYWTSTTNKFWKNPFLFGFFFGNNTSSFGKSGTHRVRCVRSVNN